MLGSALKVMVFPWPEGGGAAEDEAGGATDDVELGTGGMDDEEG